MMDCAQYRRALLADPHARDAELEAHVANCTECPAFTSRLLAFEGRLERALRVSAPERSPFDTGLAARRALTVRGGWLAMAASVIVGLIAAGGLWLAQPHSSLAAAVVAHMAGEPEAWARTDVPVPASDLSAVLAGAHMQLRSGAGTVSYAQSCEFRGHHVPHLVVQTEMGPVTVMVLAHENVSGRKPFDEDGYRGVIVPVAGHGSLAVLARDSDSGPREIEGVAARVENAIVWTN